MVYAECSQTYEKLSKRKQKDGDRMGLIYVNRYYNLPITAKSAIFAQKFVNKLADKK